MYRKSLSTIVLALTVALSGCKPIIEVPPGTGGGTLTGVVKDAETGAALAQSTVTTIPPTSSVTTNANGGFTIDNVIPGSYIVRASKSNYDSGEAIVSVSDGNTSNVQISQKPKKPEPVLGTIEGTILDAITGSPLTQSTVVTEPATITTTTDGSGRFTIAGVQPGNYLVRATKPGYEDTEASVSVGGGTSNLQMAQRPVHDERESNDEYASADPINHTESVRGMIGQGSDGVDYFRVQFPSNGVLTVDVFNKNARSIANGKVGNVTVLYPGTYEAMDGNGGYTSEASAEKLGPLPVSGNREYLIKVSQYRTETAPYRLELSFTPSSVADDMEPNNSLGSAVRLPASNEATQLIGFQDDQEDWFSITPTGTQLSIQITNLSPGNMKGSKVGKVELINQSGAVVLTINGGYTIQNANERKTASVTAGATYFVRVVRYKNESSPYRLNAYN